MTKKKILVTQRIYAVTEYQECRDALDHRWGQFFEAVGLVPILLPSLYNADHYFEESLVDGVLLTGGNDVGVVSGVKEDRLRDSVENRVIDIAAKRSIPILGVCRGMQILLCHFGAELVEVPGHVRTDHEIRGAQTRSVNSSHRYGFFSVPEEFQVEASAPDNSIEAVVHKKLPMRAMMWHPERAEPFAKADIDLLKQHYRV